MARPRPTPDSSSRRQTVWLLLALAAVFLGLFWRGQHLDNRPLHADEAVQAWQTWNLLRGEGYRYDPLDRHGPSLYYGAAMYHRLLGGDAATFDDVAARRFVLLAGALTLALFALAPLRRGYAPALGVLVAGLLAFETLSSLYQTYFVQEAWLALFVWSFVFLLLAPRSHSNLFALGLVAGLAQATKEVAPLYLLLAWLGVRRFREPSTTLTWPDRVWTVVGFLIPFVALYSSFGSHWGGLVDAFRTYALQAQRIGGDAHHYPWWHYLRTFGVLPTGGPAWGQYPLLLLALVGAGLALRRSAAPLHRAATVLTVGLLVIHSAIPYKTPWLMLTPMLGLCLLAAYTLLELGRRGRWFAAIAAVLLVGTMAQSAHVGRLALDRYPGDARNPYFYQQTPRPFLRVLDRIQDLERVLDRPLRIAVVSPDHAWPLPWYLRNREQAGFFDQKPPSNLNTWDVVIWDSQLGSFAEGQPDGALMVDYVGLRPNVLLEISVQRGLFDRTYATP
ncbi:hypothetical protein [Actomonas aquatica]|uniref:Glycosyltransferase RgtA/B/C/D-like domain-containing protein n=1 Tax=Actomonas aquatica TaxID=2866162 RepID=A0ABZ1C9S5_9BACT|nr:hypothetical protein [Opitutus sp. WL0086]WRQ88436.1 hypothetical protein K1X11_003405 [Opitutus sp. WL0086]